MKNNEETQEEVHPHSALSHLLSVCSFTHLGSSLKLGSLVYFPSSMITKPGSTLLAKETLSELLREVRENILKAGTIEHGNTCGTGAGTVSFEL